MIYLSIEITLIFLHFGYIVGFGLVQLRFLLIRKRGDLILDLKIELYDLLAYDIGHLIHICMVWVLDIFLGLVNGMGNGHQLVGRVGDISREQFRVLCT